ncbi:MAG: hypothetical protein WCJ30_13805, partial [Deltaproteobacteria bacterium]
MSSLARDTRHAPPTRPHALARTVALAVVIALAFVAVSVTGPRVAQASAVVQVLVDPPVADVGQAVRIAYSVRIRNETGAQVGALDFGALEMLSDPSPPQLPMMWGGGLALSIDTSSEYIVRANAPGRYVIAGARVYEAQSGRVISQHPPVTLVVRSPPGTPGAPLDYDAGEVDPNIPPPPPPPPPDPDAPPAGDLTGANFNPNAFLRVAVDNPNPYLGQQVTLRVWLYIGSSEANCEVSDEPTLAGFWNESLIPPTRECASRWFTTNIAGRYMSVGLVRKIAIFPSQTGVLTIGAVRASVEMISGGMFRSVQRLEVRSPDLQVEVREPPAAGRRVDYVPGTVGPVQLTAEVDRATGAVGETLAFTVHAMSDGSLASAVVAPPTNVDGVRVRVGGSHARHDTSGARVASSLDTEILVVPERPGRIDLGTVQIPYWDPARGVYDVASVQLPVITVTGAALARDDSAERGQDPQSELRGLNPSPSLRPYSTWFHRDAVALITIATPPVGLALFLSLGSLLRAMSRRRRARGREAHRPRGDRRGRRARAANGPRARRVPRGSRARPLARHAAQG